MIQSQALEALRKQAEEAEAELRDLVPQVKETPPSPIVGDALIGPAVQPPTWSDETLRRLLESLPDALVVVDQRGVIVLVNEQTERLFGYPRAEMLGRRVELLIPARYRAAHIDYREEYFAHPRTRAMGGTKRELYGRRKDGTEFPVEVSLSPLTTPDGVFATSVVRDISQRKRDEAKFRTLIENIPAVTFIAPLDESVPELYVSPQIEQLLGFSQKEWLEDPVLWYRQLHPDDRERWNGQFAPTCARGQSFEDVYRFLSKDGRVVWVHGSASLVHDADGTPSFLQGVAFDVTAIKEAESALRRFNAELDQRVQERTAELALFADIAAHDLRDPLRAIVSNLQKLAEQYRGQLGPDADNRLDRAINGACRLRDLIRGVREYSRCVQRNLVPVPTDSAGCVCEAVTNLQDAIAEAAAEVTTVGEFPTVLGHREMLVILFQNLIGNGLKFHDRSRPVCVEVGCRREEGEWLVWVRDNGIGIQEKHFSKLFRLGVEGRLHGQGGRYPGTGYGLYICRTVVSDLGGRIWFESVYGEGTTFFFTLRDAHPFGA
jgi:PAS domain S-box-containing protein